MQEHFIHFRLPRMWITAAIIAVSSGVGIDVLIGRTPIRLSSGVETTHAADAVVVGAGTRNDIGIKAAPTSSHDSTLRFPGWSAEDRVHDVDDALRSNFGQP